MENPISLQYRDYVFVGKDGTPLQNYAYNKSLARIADLIGVKKLTMHSLRHTFATRCIEDGKQRKFALYKASDDKIGGRLACFKG